MEQRGCREGTALLALELIDPKGLFLALKEQVRRQIVECVFELGSVSYQSTSIISADESKRYPSNKICGLLQQNTKGPCVLRRTSVQKSSMFEESLPMMPCTK